MKDTGHKTSWEGLVGPVIRILLLLVQVFFAISLCSAETRPGIPSIFKPESTPADSIYGLSLLHSALCSRKTAPAVMERTAGEELRSYLPIPFTWPL
jgi:hypothetical protein